MEPLLTHSLLTACSYTLMLNASDNTLIDTSTSVTWRYENSTSNSFGQEPYVISTLRQDYVGNTLASLVSSSAAATQTLLLGNSYQVPPTYALLGFCCLVLIAQIACFSD